MDMVRLVENKILSTAETFLNFLDQQIDYTTLEKLLKKELDNLGCDLMRELLEALDQKIYQGEDRKRLWNVVRQNDSKTILTPFGQLEYKRTYYRHKKTKEYAYLVDEKAGITPHMRIETAVKGELVESAAQMSYEKSTVQVSRYNPELKISKQTVASTVREFKPKEVQPPEIKRAVDTLYIEADEDHLKIRNGKSAQARLIYIHEGVEGEKRKALKQVRHFTTVIKDPVSFWLEVCDHIDTHYDLDTLKQIYLSGDGGRWIRTGQEYIPGVTFILDKFHLAKSILSATAHAPEYRRKIYQNIRALNQAGVLNKLTEALALAEGVARRKRIEQTITYIQNNWDGIEAAVKHPHIGCSAEGHVSHVLSARMSSRPMAWSLQGAEKMTSIRAVKANSDSVSEHYIVSRTKNLPLIVELKEEVKKELKRLRQKMLLGKENIGNVPLLQGVSSYTRVALRGMNGRTVV